MKVLVIGSGGREHALVWKLRQSPLTDKIFAAPGNAGMSQIAECVPIAVNKTVELAEFALAQKIDLTVVGPEAPLVAGLVDYFEEKKLKVFGPSRQAAQLEGSKAFAKSVMEKYGVPTAKAQRFTDEAEALRFLRRKPCPVVIKADGLAAGKGVTVAQTQTEAMEAVRSIMGERVFGEAGSQILIEDCLEGEEVSILGLSDGAHVALLPPSQDHKRAFDRDQGPNTGGMGAYSPVPMLNEAGIEEIRSKVFDPVIQGMRKAGTPFRGVLYAGLMLTQEGPKVLEFNVRFGDPETQAVLPRLKSDLAELMMASAEGHIDQVQVKWDPRACACVVLASQGYPGRYDMGREITEVEAAQDLEGVLVFQAGTKQEGKRLVTVGGRVFNVVGLGENLETALQRAYRGAETIQYEGKQYRRDIGARALRYAEEHAGA